MPEQSSPTIPNPLVAFPSELRTERLLLRRWGPEDRDAFAALNADPAVMEHFPSVLSRAESDALADRIEQFHAERGYGLWAVEVPGVTPFVGFTGLAVPRFEAHFTPAIEIGWRYAAAHWGKGYATEAARAVLAEAFEHLDINEIVSFTVPGNLPSRAVMERIGMTYDAKDDFEHPGVPEQWRKHVLYRVGRGVVD